MKKESIRNIKESSAEYNPRHVSEESLSTLDKTISEFGSLDGIIYNSQTDNIVSGHQRLKVLDDDSTIVKKEFSDNYGTSYVGYILTSDGARFPYREVVWDEKTEMAANIAANNNAGDWDYEQLKMNIEFLDDGEFDLGLTGFDTSELDKMFAWTSEDELSLIPEEVYSSDDDGEVVFDESVSEYIEEDIDQEQLTQIKVNVTIEMSKWLDEVKAEQSLHSRSQAIRSILNEYRGK